MSPSRRLRKSSPTGLESQASSPCAWLLFTSPMGTGLLIARGLPAHEGNVMRLVLAATFAFLTACGGTADNKAASNLGTSTNASAPVPTNSMTPTNSLGEVRRADMVRECSDDVRDEVPAGTDSMRSAIARLIECRAIVGSVRRLRHAPHKWESSPDAEPNMRPVTQQITEGPNDDCLARRSDDAGPANVPRRANRRRCLSLGCQKGRSKLGPGDASGKCHHQGSSERRAD